MMTGRYWSDRPDHFGDALAASWDAPEAPDYEPLLVQRPTGKRRAVARRKSTHQSENPDA
jgi:hypothetical protein